MTVAFHRLALAATTGLALFAGAAQAADLRRPAPMAASMAEAQPVYPTLWSGLYLGGHIGYGWGEADGRYVDPFTTTAGSGSTDLDGLIGGVQIGYNWQALSWVYGIEADFAWSGMDGGRTVALPLPGPVLGVDTQINWMSTVRARIGYAPDRWLIYATGGVAFADFDIDVTDGVNSTSDGSTHVGWTVGAGVEYALTDAWRMGLEYKYADFGSETYSAPLGGTANVDLDVHAVTFRVNYRF